MLPEEIPDLTQGTERWLRLLNKKDPSPQFVYFFLVGIPTGDEAEEIKLDLRMVHMPVIIHNYTHNPAPDGRSGDEMQDLDHGVPPVCFL